MVKDAIYAVCCLAIPKPIIDNEIKNKIFITRKINSI